MSKPRFALDQNFPVPIVNSLRDYICEAELVSIRDVDARLPTLEDWEVLRALYQLGDWDGLITTDSGMLKLPRELAVMLQTKLTLIVAEAVGHDPVKATGLVLTHLPQISRLTGREDAQVWVLNAVTRPHRNPWDYLAAIAKRVKKQPRQLYEEHRLSPADLSAKPLHRQDR